MEVQLFKQNDIQKRLVLRRTRSCNRKKYYECKRTHVVTNNFYTKPVKEFAKVNIVIIYDREWLELKVYKKMNQNIKSGVS